MVSIIGISTVSFIDGMISGVREMPTNPLVAREISNPNLRLLENVFYMIMIIPVVLFIFIVNNVSIRQETKHSNRVAPTSI